SAADRGVLRRDHPHRGRFDRAGAVDAAHHGDRGRRRTVRCPRRTPDRRQAARRRRAGWSPGARVGARLTRSRGLQLSGICHLITRTTVNKKELVDAVAKGSDLTQADAERALTAVFDTIAKGVAAGDKVSVPGFGTFEKRERAARTGRNPRTG